MERVHRVPSCGAASTTDGHSFAFGNTLEALRTRGLGHAARGSGRPLDCRKGVGRVTAKDGDYADALAKGHSVHLLATESTGAMRPTFVHLLHALSRCVGLPDVHDSTVYGSSHASARRTHHATRQEWWCQAAAAGHN